MLLSCLARTENKQSDKANRNTRENVVVVVAAVQKARVVLHKVCYHCCYVNAHCMNRRKSSFCCLHFVEGEKLAKALTDKAPLETVALLKVQCGNDFIAIR